MDASSLHPWSVLFLVLVFLSVVSLNPPPPHQKKKSHSSKNWFFIWIGLIAFLLGSQSVNPY